MNLCKWRTNSKDLLQHISEEAPIDGPKKVLGVKWDELKDKLIIDVKDFINEMKDNKNLTKRHVLSIVAAFYDPVGYIQPIIIKLKIFFQEVCSGGYNWDDVLDEKLTKKWNLIMGNILTMDVVEIPRCYSINNVKDPYVSIELIGFSDASLEAYGCCVYFIYILQSNNVKIAFVASKSRVAPLKRKETIPRLELMGNLLLSRLVQNIVSAVKDEIVFDKITCFTDSQVSLSWIKAEAKELKTFVQNRVIEIRKNVE